MVFVLLGYTEKRGADGERLGSCGFCRCRAAGGMDVSKCLGHDETECVVHGHRVCRQYWVPVSRLRSGFRDFEGRLLHSMFVAGAPFSIKIEDTHWLANAAQCNGASNNVFKQIGTSNSTRRGPRRSLTGGYLRYATPQLRSSIGQPY